MGRMVRDIDFKVRRVSSKPPIKTTNLVATDTTVERGGTSRLLWVIILALLVAAIIGIWQLLALSEPTSSSLKTSPISKQNSAIATPNSSDDRKNLLSPQTSGPLVQIYDSGAGPSVVQSLTNKLTSLGYKVENLEKSQFNYNRTYIRYREGMLVEAEKIKSALPDQLVSMSEVKSAGLFDILILYGTK